MVRVHDDNRIGVRHIEPGLDDTRTHEDIELARKEALHHAFQVAVVHLPVGHRHAGFRHPGFHFLGKGIDILHAVIDNENLAAPRKLVTYGGGKHHIVALHELGLYGQTVHRRRVDKRNVAHARHAQM